MSVSAVSSGPEQSAFGGEGQARISAPARRLLEAADRLFYAHGVRATTVREITSACGLSPGALYNHFASKDELLYALVGHRHLRLERDVIAAQKLVVGDPIAEFVAIVEVYVRAHAAGRQGAQVANREYRYLTGPRLEEVIAIRRRLRDRMVSVLRRGSRDGAFDVVGGADKKSLTITAATILEMCINCSQWFRPQGSTTLEELEQRFVDLSLRMAGCSAPTSHSSR
jgi:TetR/AcrR family transcriptional regulator, cholesterol catabolism regulator